MVADGSAVQSLADASGFLVSVDDGSAVRSLADAAGFRVDNESAVQSLADASGFLVSVDDGSAVRSLADASGFLDYENGPLAGASRPSTIAKCEVSALSLTAFRARL